MLLHARAVTFADKLAGHLDRVAGLGVFEQCGLIKLQIDLARIEQVEQHDILSAECERTHTGDHLFGIIIKIGDDRDHAAMTGQPGKLAERFVEIGAVGGGGAVRIPKLIGVARMTDMMMTGRVYNAVDGERVGFAQYLVPAGTAFDKALELAKRIATNAPLTNYALMHALPRIAEQTADHGFVTESLMSSITQAAPEAKARVEAFLQGRAAKVENK